MTDKQTIALVRIMCEKTYSKGDRHPYFTDDDYSPGEWIGSNADDVFEAGMSAGREECAGDVLDLIKETERGPDD